MRTCLCVSLCVRGERESQTGRGGGLGGGIIYWFSTPSEMCIGYIRATRELDDDELMLNVLRCQLTY